MKGKTKKTYAELRRRAQDYLTPSGKVVEVMSPQDVRKLVHELDTYQIELELQNEGLRRTKDALEQSNQKYSDLYEFAPVGYFSFDAKGRILAVNLTGGNLLGMKNSSLLKKAFSSFMSQDDSDLFYLHLQKVIETKSKQTCTITLFQANVKPFYAQLDSIHSSIASGDKTLIQTTVTDITGQEIIAGTSWKVHHGMERREMERRTMPLVNEQLGQEREEYRQTEEALEEINTLKERLVVENIYFHPDTIKKHQFGEIIGQSDGIKYVLYRAEQVAPTDTTVLILGETGTGKELVASAIHHMSPRKEKSLVTVNCAALPDNLLESELFGREKGAFTGADSRQIGRFEVADGSTLCLDEIGEMPMEMQAKLLRVIQHGEFQRLGSSKTIKVDVRIVATTNCNLEEAIFANRFRKDLYYRLNVFPITVPPLRQRKEDIPLMVQTFVDRYAHKLSKRITSIPKETMQMLCKYAWPGNIRELESIIERGVILCSGPGFQLADRLDGQSSPELFPGETMKEMEYNLIMKTLKETCWRIEGKEGAAMILGLHPSTLRARMHKIGIERP